MHSLSLALSLRFMRKRSRTHSLISHKLKRLASHKVIKA